MSGCDYVTLRGGRTIPVPVLRRLWDLEERGVRLRLDGDDVLVGPRKLLDESDRTFLREYKVLIMLLLSGEVRL